MMKVSQTFVIIDWEGVFGIDIQTLYLFGLIIGGSITLIYVLFGDVFEAVEAIADIAPGALLNPVVILSFISVLSGAGYIFESNGTFDSFTILILSTLISLVVVGFIHFFILIPLSESEENTARSIKDFIGKTGEVITTIPVSGVGEVFINSRLGSSGNIATSASNLEITQGKIVIVVEIEDGVLIVEPIEEQKQNT